MATGLRSVQPGEWNDRQRFISKTESAAHHQQKTNHENPGNNPSSQTSRNFESGPARASRKGAVTPAYQGDVNQTIEILQAVLATEIVCVLRYTMNAIAATGISSDSVKKEFDEHAKEEQEHMRLAAERINQLGGIPNFDPEGLATRAVSQYAWSAPIWSK